MLRRVSTFHGKEDVQLSQILQSWAQMKLGLRMTMDLSIRKAWPTWEKAILVQSLLQKTQWRGLRENET